MDEYNELFCRQHMCLQDELTRLFQLYEDVLWYNFELAAMHWHTPWPVTDRDSALQLCSMRFETVQIRGGRQCEKGSFPVYYFGRIADAPKLPAQILYVEIVNIKKELALLEDMCTAAYDWAPGGDLYERHMRESDGSKLYNQLSKENKTDEWTHN